MLGIVIGAEDGLDCCASPLVREGMGTETAQLVERRTGSMPIRVRITAVGDFSVGVMLCSNSTPFPKYFG